MFEPDANYDKQRRLIAYAPILQPACVVAMTGTALCFRPPQQDRAASLGANYRQEARCVNGSGMKR
jgi:hypothetical protein